MALSQSLTIKWIKRILPVILGAIAGYSYYYFIGCVNGACPISSNPYISTAYGVLIGALLIPRKKMNDEGVRIK